jgi:hypothetical protein
MSALSSLVLATLPLAGFAAAATSSLALAMAPSPAPAEATPAEDESEEDEQPDRRTNRTQWYPGGTIGGDFALWRVGLRACAVFGSGKVSTPICGGADTGMLTATGVGIETPRTERRPWSSVFADVDMVWHVRPRLGLVVTSRGLVPLVRQQFYVGDRGTLVTTSPFGVEIGLGLEIILL